MPFNTLLLPLLGGYVFVANFNRTKYRARRHTGNRLILDAALAGALFLFVAVLIVGLLQEYVPGLRTWWKDVAPFAYSGTSTVALLLGLTLWWPLNGFFRDEAEISRVIEQDSDYLESLLEKALREYRMISVTTATGKVYVGDVTSNFLPASADT